MDPYRFTHRLRVRRGECDMQGIVFNPHYMAYIDVALTEYWRAIGLPYPQAFLEEGTDTFMAAASQTYRDAACFDDELDVALRTACIGTTSLQFAFEIRRAGAVLFEGEATYVNADRQTRRPRPWSERVLACITGYETTAPARKAAAQ
jgi:acyl-CoA thioester hydrolase